MVIGYAWVFMIFCYWLMLGPISLVFYHPRSLLPYELADTVAPPLLLGLLVVLASRSSDRMIRRMERETSRFDSLAHDDQRAAVQRLGVRSWLDMERKLKQAGVHLSVEEMEELRAQLHRDGLID